MPFQPTAVVIEDDVATQALLAAVARRCGLTTRTAGDGEAGMALILAEPPAVLIIDLALPRVSGLDVLRRLQEVAPVLLKRTVVVTADELLLRADGNALRSVACVLRKPFDIELLIEELERCIALAKSAAAQPAPQARQAARTDRFH
jgi:DNA-binding NtrC family response regulator